VNKYRLVQGSVWAAAGLVLAVSLAAWSTAVPVRASNASSRGGTPAIAAPGAAVDTAQLAADAASLRDRDPFRSDRKPADLRFNPWEPVQPVIQGPRPAKPALVLVGIVGGPPWTALIEGIPQRETGILLRVGEEIGSIRLEDVRADTARLSGFDTSWVLTQRRPWR
jgi:hypothetical protein